MNNRLILDKKETIPKGIFKKFSINCRNTYNFLRSKSSLPPLFYIFRIALVFYQSVLPCYFPLNKDLWEDGMVTTQLIRFLSFFSYFGAAADGNTATIISSIINLFVFAFILFLNLFTTLYFKLYGHLKRGLMMTLLFCNDICLPVFSSYVFSQIGQLLGELVFDHFESVNLIMIILLVLVVSLTLVIFTLYYYPCVIYTPGNSLFWVSSDDTIFFFAIGIPNFLSRFLDFSDDDTASTIIHVVFFVIYILIFVYYCYVPHFLNHRYNNLYRGILLGGLVISIIQTIDFLDQDIVFLFSIVIFAITVILLQIISYSIIQKYLTKLDLVIDQPEDISEILKSKLSLMISTRIGIYYAHPAILGLHPFREVIRRYPSSKTIWEAFLRFVAIYPEENLALMSAIDEIKKRFRDDPRLKTIRSLAVSIIQSRSKHMSSPLKRKLKQFDEHSRQIKSIMISYWTAISENSEIATFDLAQQVIKEREELRSNYLHQLSLFPNSWQLCTHYGKALESLEKNQTESEYWISRGQMMRKSEQITDRCHLRGLATFPNLPNVLNEYETAINRHNYNGSVSSRSSRSSRSSVSSRSQISGMSQLVDADQQLQEEQKTISEHLRQMSLKAHVPFVTHLIIFVLCIFIIFGFIYPFLPGITTMLSLTAIRDYWTIIDDSTSLSYHAARYSYLVSYHVAKIKKSDVFLPYIFESILLAINISELYDSNKVIPELARAFSHDIDNILKDMSKYYEQTEDVSDVFFKTTIKATFPGIPTPTSMTIPDLLSYTSSQLFGYDDAQPNYDYCNESWFIFSMMNIVSLAQFFFDFSYNLYDTAIDHYDSAMDITIAITVVVDIVFCGISALFFFLVYDAHKKWKEMIAVYSQLPKSCIHETIAYFSAANANSKVTDEERLYFSEFMTMATSRDSTGGIPVLHIMFLYAFLMVCILLSSVLVFITTPNATARLKKVPKRFVIMRETESRLYYAQSMFNIFFATYLKCPILSESEDVLLFLAIQQDELVSKMMKEFVIGSNDGSNYGLMSASNPGILETLFDSDPLVRDSLTMHEFMFALPHVFLLNTMHQLIQENRRAIENNESVNFQYVIFLNHMLEHHWDDDVDKRYATYYQETMNDEIPSAIGQMIGYPFICIGVELVIVIILMIIFHKIQQTVRFCLSTLAFIDMSFVTQSQEFTNFLSGQFVTDKNAKSIEQSTINIVPDCASEIIVVIEPDRRISYINQSADTKWNLKAEDCVDVDVDLVLRFSDETVDNYLKDILNGLNPTVNSIETTVTIVSSEKKIPIKVTFFPIKNRRKLKQVAIIIVDTSIMHTKQEQLEQEKKQCRELQLKMYPQEIVDKINIEKNNLLVISKRIVVVTIQLADIDNILKGEEPTKIFSQYRKAIHDTVNNDRNASHVKTLGSYEIIVFNFNGDEDSIDSDRKAIGFCKAASTALKNEGIQGQFSLTSDTKCPMGMLNPRHMNFDIYGRSFRMGIFLANEATANSVCVDRIEVGTVTEIINEELTSKELILKGTKILAYEYKMP